VVVCLPSKHKAMSSNPSLNLLFKKKKKQKNPRTFLGPHSGKSVFKREQKRESDLCRYHGKGCWFLGSIWWKGTAVSIRVSMTRFRGQGEQKTGEHKKVEGPCF
jgi:hypothetical protein